MGDQPSESLAAIVGRNCKRLRVAAGLTQDDLAQHGRRVGLRWRATSVGDFEAGRSAPTFSTVLAVTLALQNATRRDVTLDELIAGDGMVALTDGIDVAAPVLAGACQGKPFRLSPGAWKPKVRSASSSEIHALVGGVARDLLARSGLAEQRLARQLGVSPTRLAATSSMLWGRTFSEERDHRAGPDDNAQKRGRVSRTLRTELQRALGDGNDQ
jgi:transcriptional regulator with XRE-family HTH domain